MYKDKSNDGLEWFLLLWDALGESKAKRMTTIVARQNAVQNIILDPILRSHASINQSMHLFK